MAYYNELNDFLQNIVQINLLGNPNIKKLLYYYPSTIDYSYSPFYDENENARPDVSSKEIYMNYILPYPKSSDIVTEQKCYLHCNLGGGTYIDGAKWRNINIIFDIICHLDVWIIKEGFRVYSIANEIDKTFNNQNPQGLSNTPDLDYYKKLDIPSINKPIALPFKPIAYSKKYYGLQLIYSTQINSNLNCE